MIVVQLSGGLGNQMFQYAFGLALAERQQTELVLDLRQTTADPDRPYWLNRLNITATIASKWDLFLADGCHPLAGSRRKWLHHFLAGRRWHCLQDHQQGFDPAVFHHSGHIFAIGYWQSPRYFDAIAERIRQEFTVRDPLSATAQSLLGEIQSTNSVAVHVRRGDYLSNPAANRTHGVCGLDYYQRAVELIRQHVANPSFFVFSDEPAWAEANLTFLQPAKFVRSDSAASPVSDLRLMSACQHIVTANSTFSWWAAWLPEPRADRLVIAPKTWFAGRENLPDLIPDGWIQV